MDWSVLLHALDPANAPTLDLDFAKRMGQILWIDVLLSGDNALVVAAACAGLPPRQRFVGILLGALIAALLRVVFAFGVGQAVQLGGFAAIGGLVLLYIAVKLVTPEPESDHEQEAGTSLLQAVGLIIMADVSMSFDNVLALANVSAGDPWLLSAGILVSVLIVVGGSSFIAPLLERYPAVKWGGALFLGWVAGGIVAQDTYVAAFIGGDRDALHHVFGYLGVLYVLTLGLAIRKAGRDAARAQPALAAPSSVRDSSGPPVVPYSTSK